MYDYLLYFLIFSFLGWCIEVVYCSVREGRVVNRGLASGPVCPIYGVGVCLNVFLLGGVGNTLFLFLLSTAIATAVEFFAGLALDLAFDLRLWNYGGERGNLFGYVCPRYSVFWGIASVGAIRALPVLLPVLKYLSSATGRLACFALAALIVVDTSLSVIKLIKGRKVKFIEKA